MPIIKKLCRFTALAAALLCAIPALAIPGEIPYVPVAGAAPTPLEERAGLRSVEELEVFIDGVMADQLPSHGLAGAIVAVVKDGELFFVKGYGYADIDAQQKMNGETSLIRPGSISKLFTWTALMQLVEQGKVDLDTDVNRYLTSLKVPDTFPEPITPRNLLTHTAGLEDGALGYLIVNSADELKPIAEYLQLHMPERVRPPTRDFSRGDNAAYSNWGTALAGVIVEDVSGLPFDDYVEQNIFQPLGMTRSTFREPLPEAMQADAAVGYLHEAGTFKAHDFEYIHNFAPAGSVTASVPDMARFMIAHLQQGRYGDKRILKPETAALMHSRQFSPHPHVNGSGLGFYETYINGRRVIGHGGDLSAYHSDLSLLPAEGVGLFVSYTSTPSMPVMSREHLFQVFMDRYYPAVLPKVEPPADFKERAAQYAGSYRSNRMNFSKIEKIFYGLNATKVAPTEDNTLLISGLMGPGASQWVEIAPDTFREERSDKTIAFLRDASGEVSHLTFPFAFMASFKLTLLETIEFHGFLLLLTIIAAVVAIVGAFYYRSESDQGAKRARWLAAGNGALLVVAIGLLVAAVVAAASDPLAGFPGFIYLALCLFLLCVALTIVVIVCAARAWRDGYWTLGTRLRYSVIALLYLSFMGSLYYWNLIGFHFG